MPPPNPRPRTSDEGVCLRSEGLREILAEVIAEPLRQLVHDLHLVEEVRRDHFKGEPFTFEELARRAASQMLAWLIRDPYASERYIGDRRVQDVTCGMNRAELRNILLSDLVRSGLLVLENDRADLTLAVPPGGRSLPGLLTEAVQQVQDGTEVLFQLGQQQGQVQVRGPAEQFFPTLYEAVYELLRLRRKAAEDAGTPKAELASPMLEAARSCHGWALCRLADCSDSLDDVRVRFFARWAESSLEVEQFWRENAWRGNTPERPLRHWLRQAVLGGNWPMEPRDVGRSLLARSFLQLKEGVLLECSICGERVAGEGEGGGHRCPGVQWPIPPAVREAHHLERTGRFTLVPFLHCENNGLWCEAAELCTATGALPAAEHPPPLDFAPLAPGEAVACSAAGGVVGAVVRTTRAWSRLRFSFEGQAAGPALAGVEVWRLTDGAPGARLAAAALHGPDGPGWVPLEVGRVESDERSIIRGPPIQGGRSRNTPLGRHQGRSQIVLHVAEEGCYAVLVRGPGNCKELRCTWTFDQCGHYWQEVEGGSRNCPRCGGTATQRPTQAMVSAQPPSRPSPATPTECLDEDCLGLCHLYDVIEHENGGATYVLVCDGEPSHRFEFLVTRAMRDQFDLQNQGGGPWPT